MFTKTDAEAYFNAEKAGSLLFVIVGMLAILVAVVLYFIYKTNFFKGFAIPLVLIGIIQVVVGSTVYNRSDKQRVDIVYKMDMNPPAIREGEIPRMEKVMKSFTMYRYIEIVLLLAGIGLYWFNRNNEEKHFLMGLGIALALQAGIMLVADGFAEKRGKDYEEGLKAMFVPR